MDKFSAKFQDLIEEGEDPTGEVVVIPEVDESVPEVITEALDTTVTSFAPTAMERAILEKALQGIGVAQMSYALGVPETHIRTFLRNPKVKTYMKELKEVVNEIDQMMLTGTLRKVIGHRVDKLSVNEDGEVDFAGLTNKDTLDVLKVFADMTNQVAKGQEKEKSDDVFVNIYNQILK